MTNQIAIYDVESKKGINLIQNLILLGRNCLSSRELIWQLFRRDFFAVHKKSLLGKSWVLISPIVAIISWVLMNAFGILNPGNVGIPYPAYILIGTSIWGLFIGIYQSAAGTLSVGQGFITQVKYPHEVLLAKQVFDQLVNFFLSFSIIVITLIIFRILPSWQIVFLPVLILPLALLGSGLGLIMSCVSVVASDMKKIMDIFLVNLIFLTPIIYSKNITNPVLSLIIKIHPCAILVGGVRDTIIYGQLDSPWIFGFWSMVALVSFIISLRFFYSVEGTVIEKLI
ncbi:ABC transporter permease [Patescibacteria group bacterium]|nr:ABC transporter permease [Patescibacteria group bacterium]